MIGCPHSQWLPRYHAFLSRRSCEESLTRGGMCEDIVRRKTQSHTMPATKIKMKKLDLKLLYVTQSGLPVFQANFPFRKWSLPLVTVDANSNNSLLSFP